MRTIKYLFFAYLGLIVLAIGAYAVARSYRQPRDPQTFSTVFTVSLRSLEAAKVADVASSDITGHIYETLYNYKYGGAPDELIPQVAADFPSVSDDGLTYTIPIRRGIRFYDPQKTIWPDGVGPEITAHDVVFSWKRFADFNVAAPGYSSLLQDNIVGLDDFRSYTEKAGERNVDYDREVSGLKAIDDRTLQVTLTRPIPNFTQLIAGVPAAVISRDVIAKIGTMRERPIGSGPYALIEYKNEQRIILERNPIYRGRPDVDGEGGKRLSPEERLPKIERILLEYAAEPLPAWHWFLKQRYDQMTIPKETFDAAITKGKELSPDLAARGIKLHKRDDAGLWYIQFNMTDPVIGKNPALRQAMSLAIDREKYIRVYRNGRGKPATSILPPDSPQYDPSYSSKWTKLDLDAARAKLKEAEAINGGPIPVLKLEMGATDTERRQVAEFFTQQWAQIGLRIEPSYNTYARFLDKMDSKTYQITYTGWSPDYPDAKTYLRLFDSTLAQPPGSNTFGYSNPTYQSILERSLTMKRSPERDVLYKQCRDILDDELPAIPIFYTTTYTLQYDWVGNVKTPWFTMGFYAYQTLDVEKRRAMLGN